MANGTKMAWLVVNESYGNSERRLLYYFKYIDTDTYERDSRTQ